MRIERKKKLAGMYTVRDVKKQEEKIGTLRLQLLTSSWLPFRRTWSLKKGVSIQKDRRKTEVFTLSGLFSLFNGLDDTDSHSLPHVTNGETTKRWVLVVRLDTHGLGWNEFDNASITRLDKFRTALKRLASPTVNLLNQLGKLACNVGGVAIKHRGITSTDLARVVEDNDLSIEGGSLFGRVVLGVRGDIAATNILDRHVPAYVVSDILAN